MVVEYARQGCVASRLVRSLRVLACSCDGLGNPDVSEIVVYETVLFTDDTIILMIVTSCILAASGDGRGSTRTYTCSSPRGAPPRSWMSMWHCQARGGWARHPPPPWARGTPQSGGALQERKRRAIAEEAKGGGTRLGSSDRLKHAGNGKMIRPNQVDILI